MRKLKREYLECIKEDNSEEEDEKQWKRTKIVFDHFYNYLVEDRGLKKILLGNERRWLFSL